MILRKGRLGEPDVDIVPVSGADTISLASRLTRLSYALAGRPFPTYAGAQIPCRFVPSAPMIELPDDFRHLLLPFTMPCLVR